MKRLLRILFPPNKELTEEEQEANRRFAEKWGTIGGLASTAIVIIGGEFFGIFFAVGGTIFQVPMIALMIIIAALGIVLIIQERKES